MAEHTLLLVDGSSYLYRAFHALPDLRGPGQFPTGAIHGFVAMMRRIREQIGAEHAACVFDAKGPTFRDGWYPQYKAQRAPMPEDLVRQIEPIHEVVKLLGWPILMVPGVEADDVIGTLARVGAEQGHQVIISTGDKDLAQLVNAQVSLINTMSNERLDEAGVLAKFGVAPNRIIDYLTLMGDAVDNVPGVEKVGPKTAAKWIAEHGSLQGVMDAATSIKGVAGENLRKALDWLPTGRKLVTVVTDCDLNEHVSGWPDLNALALQAEKRDQLLGFYERFGFKTWKRELETALGGSASPTASAKPAPKASNATGDLFAQADEPLVVQAVAVDKQYETILTEEALQRWVDKITQASQAGQVTALDTETDSLDAMKAELVGISLSVKPGEAAYIPLRHHYAGSPEQLPVEVVLRTLKPWLEDASAHKLGQNIKYDTHVLQNAGVQVAGYVHDTLLESYVLEAHKPHSLESLALRHLGRQGL
ncbi:MAG: 5'-3' exonuclease H3TH domain-containing protein, partial [Burkholderiaceae bacterium]